MRCWRVLILVLVCAIFQFSWNPKIHADTATESGPENFQRELYDHAPAVPSFVIENPARLSWEAPNHPERRHWSRYAESVINLYLDELDEVDDMPSYCKTFDSLNREQKIEVWAKIFS